jgi:tetratricopeptide (TPR) repeat protein
MADKDDLFVHTDTTDDFEELKRVQEEALGKFTATGVDAEINAAAQKLVSQDFDGAIAEYARIKSHSPENAGLCEHQIGVAWFFKGDFEKAIEHYTNAKSLGAPEMDEEIEEAREMLAKK